MEVLIPDIWLREFLKTKATDKQIAKYLSLCGPSIDRLISTSYGPVYSVDVTTNRVDSASVYGIAREAAAILPRFKVKASLRSIKLPSLRLSRKVSYLDATVDHKLCPRFTAVLIKKVHIKDSPSWMKDKLSACGVRPINNVVDISNYIMCGLGQPVHTFDYDKIARHKMILRPARNAAHSAAGGESITTLDGKKHKLPGGDIVIEDGEGKLIDLAGIMGGQNSAVDEKTKNVLLFVQTYNPVNIRKTSMALGHRTEAAVLFEKGLDPEMVIYAVARGIELFEKTAGGKVEKKILDLYPEPYKTKTTTTSIDFINGRLGIEISKSEISKILNSLEFEVVWKGKTVEVSIPSYRAGDVNIPEDLVEEVARIYGYHSLPSELMAGKIPEPLPTSPFSFERKVKDILKGYGGVEVYTSSMVSEKSVSPKDALKLKNPLGKDSEYLRVSLAPSLVAAADDNKGEEEPFHLFEMANAYLARKHNLPEEKMMLAGILSKYNYREARGIIEALLEELNIERTYVPQDSMHFKPNQRIAIKSKGREIGQFGVLENDYLYYEFEVESLRKRGQLPTYQPLPKYPPQVEDITLTFPEKTKIGEVIETIYNLQSTIHKVELRDIYKDSYTFRILYQHPTKTLTDKDVEDIRTKLLKVIREKFGANTKD